MKPEEILAALDPEQQEAAEALVGPVRILAGAGTGKTRTITHRIAYGIARGFFSANRVMALTYTNRAAGELRARLRSLGIPAVSVKTFHAAALSQLQFFWPQFAGVPAPNVLESKASLIAKAADELRIRLDANAVREVAAEIEWRKYSCLSLEQYEQLAESRPLAFESAKSIVQIQQKYEELKIASNRIDWEDVLVLTLGMLRAEPRAREHVHSQYRFYTVDEYQDISPLQHQLLDEWLGNRSDLCVVGDPNQTIYSFTGASANFLMDFDRRFENAQTIQLIRNYRSTREIVAVANRLTYGVSSLEPLISEQQQGLAPLVRSYSNVLEEAEAVAQAIRQKLSQGIPPKEIAVLYRVNGQSEALENALSKEGIDFQVRGGERYFNRTDVKSAIQAVRAETAAPSAKPLALAVSDIVRSLGWTVSPPEQSGLARERWEALNSFLEMVNELPPGSNIHDFAKELDERARSSHEPQKSTVTLATIHSAKGLEWDVVYLIGANEGYLPISYAKTESEVQEERRLLYVAITRARKELTISYAQTDLQTGRSKARSRFLDQIT
ncbi:MAG: hypothetical protein RLZZ400_412 [Actinomycetota bacterium]